MSLSIGVLPAKWKFANITPAFKKDDPTITSNYRPISLLCVISKVLERCVFNHCYHHLSPSFYQFQHGFLKGKSTTTQLLEVYHDILDSVASGNEVDVIYLDLSKAFDKVPHNLLLLKLKHYGINGSLLSWFGSYLTDRYQTDHSLTGFLSHLVYHKVLYSVHCCLFYTSMMSLTTFSTTQQLLCLLTIPSCSNPFSIQPPVTIFRVTSTACKGGVWTGETADKTLGLVKSVCKELPDLKVRKLLNCALVRPKLEYASSLWSPYTVKYRSLIENVQRRATKFILNYPPDMSYTRRLARTNLLPLEFRREISDLMLLFKSRAGLIFTDVNDFLCTFEPKYRSRNYDINNYNLITKHKQDYYRKSFFIRSAELWNCLPSYLKVYHSLRAFKYTLINLYITKLSTYSPPGCSG